MADLPPNSIDAIVTDPPYGLEFMGKEWDKLQPHIGPNGSSVSKKITYDMSPGPGGKTNPWKTERNGYGAPHKNPRCKTCGRLKFDHSQYKCQCESPDWDTRQYEYAQQMQSWHYNWAVAALRVAKPGAYLLAFGGTRTFHRLACAIEDAGWEIRDTLMWVYGSGFPKSLDVSKAIDKAAGVEREVVNIRKRNGGPSGMTAAKGWHDGPMANDDSTVRVTTPATSAAIQWQGWGTALKPAWEPIIMARKPLDGTVANNVLKWGTGGINVDGCRINGEWKRSTPDQHDIRGGAFVGSGIAVPNLPQESHPSGRFPANLIHDGSEEVMGLFPESKSNMREPTGGHVYGHPEGGNSAAMLTSSTMDTTERGYTDSGSAARFFYCAKASRAERDMGCEGLNKKMLRWSSGDQSPGTFQSEGTDKFARNFHPTVKPLSLMRYLCRLVTPPNGIVLDPFAGSGSTCVAADQEGFRYIGIELDPEYCRIAECRVKGLSGESQNLF